MKKSPRNNPTLSVIILSFNTKDLLFDCLSSLKKIDEVDFEIIVSDNGSSDGSADMVRKKFPKVILIENNLNLGFAKGNNMARKVARGKYILFLNSDTVVYPGAFQKTVEFLNEKKDVAAVTCKVLLPNGKLDLDTRRSFPTPWVSLTHFSRLDRLFPKSQIFSKYWYGYKSIDETHEIDVLQGAFCLVRKQILDKIDWFDEDYFLDGEDIDLCWKIKELNYKIYYHPTSSILHLKGASKGKNSSNKVAFKIKMKSVLSGLNSMEIFYRKRMWKNYPLPLNYLVIFGINILKLLRLIKLAL